MLARISQELLPGEKILVFGFGAEKRTDKLQVVRRTLLLLSLSFAVCTFSAQAPFTAITILAFLAVLLLVPMLFGQLLTSGTTSDSQYYALTSNRLLTVTIDGVQTVAARSQVTKIHNKEEKITIHLGSMSVLLERLPASEIESPK